MAICQLSVVGLMTYWADFFEISLVACHGPYTQTLILIFEKKKAFSNFTRFLALLDCVSRAYSMGLCPSVVRPSVVRQIISEDIGHIAFKFQLLLALGNTQICFLNF